MPSLLETVTSLLRQSENLERLGEMLGIDAPRASALVDLATPVVITGLADRAFEPGGSDIVVRLLDGIDPSIVDNPLVFVERGDASIGEGLLVSIFADQHGVLTSALAEEGSVTEPVISRLLPGILALAIGVLGRRRAVSGVDEVGVLELLSAEKSVLPADRRSGVDGHLGTDRGRVPAMAGTAAAIDSATVSGAAAEAAPASSGSTGDIDTTNRSATASAGDMVGVGAETAGGSEPSDRSNTPGDSSSGSGDRNGRGPLVLIVGGLAVVVLLAWTLSQIGIGEQDDAGFVAQPADDGGGDERSDDDEPSDDDAGATSADTAGETTTPADDVEDSESSQNAEVSDGEDDADSGDEDAEPVTINEELSLDPITFEVGSARITAEGLAVLDVAADYLRADPGLTIEIAGHTDSDGDAADNMRLSQDRADVVWTYLESQGIDGARMTAIGYGENDPVASNDTDEGKARNRRIEFIIR